MKNIGLQFKFMFLLGLGIASASTARSELLFRGLLSYSEAVPVSERYPEEVALFGKPEVARVPGYDLILHLHGFRQNRDGLQGRLETFDDVLKEFDFDTLLQNSGRRAVLVVPSSLGKCDTFTSHLIPEDRLLSFIQAVFQKIGTYPNRIILIGHSGSYHALAAITQSSLQSFISELYLLDATYGEEQKFAQFASLPKHRLVSVYRKDTSTAQHSFQLWQLLNPVAQYSTTIDQFYQLSYGPSVQANELPVSGSAFIATDGDHWRVVNDYWSRLIAPTGSAPTRGLPSNDPSTTP